MYGRDFTSRWEGLDLAEVKADWMRELGGLLDTPNAIRHGLERLPTDKPPNVLQFRAICIGAPGDRHAPLSLASPAPSESDKERIRALLSKARANVTRVA